MTISKVSEIIIKAPATHVFMAFTRSLLLRQWLCDFATVQPRPGGRIYLWWNGDFYSSGQYLELKENEQVKFNWQSRLEPAASTVTITITPRDDGTHLTLIHEVPEGNEWETRVTGFKQEWDSSLPNLASLLETGLDRRIFDRPMLGIQVSDFNAVIAKSLGIPTVQGIRVADTIEGMGARQAGLQKDDVIIEFNQKPITTDFSSLAAALQGKKGGDPVEVVFYRGASKQKTDMVLTKRPIPVVPQDKRELAQKVEELYRQGISHLETVLKGATENEVTQKPADGEWSPLQVLAHLIQSERERLIYIGDILNGYERNTDGYDRTPLIYLDATISAFKNATGMLGELKRLTNEVVTLLSTLPDDFVSIKCNYFTVGSTVVDATLPHIKDHSEQIKATIMAARKKKN